MTIITIATFLSIFINTIHIFHACSAFAADWRPDSLLRIMTLDEKIGQLNQLTVFDEYSDAGKQAPGHISIFPAFSLNSFRLFTKRVRRSFSCSCPAGRWQFPGARSTCPQYSWPGSPERKAETPLRISCSGSIILPGSSPFPSPERSGRSPCIIITITPEDPP